MKNLIALIFLHILFICSARILASEADVIDADVIRGDDGSFTFNVTVQHADEGWNHYADHWLILDKDEQVIAARKLMHPHVKEQPFTRRLSYIEIPDEVTEVTIRAHCSVDNYSGKDMLVKIK
jgi:hypothetical protein